MLKTSSIAIFLLTFIISPLSVAQNPCSGKIEMLCGQSYVYTLASGSGSWNPTGPWGTPGDEAIFFFNPPSDGLYNITITNNDFYVNLFSKTANCGKQNWQYQDRVNAAGVISLNLLAGVTYHFLIDDENTTESSGTINIACLNLLPVELIAFEGQNAGRQNKLRWITASEVDNDYFIVERSDDGVAFEQIAKIEGQGTTTVQTDYDYTDITFQSPTNYYRLTQVDFNGDRSIHEVIALETNVLSELSLFPNPSQGKVHVSLNSEIESPVLWITNQLGQVIMEKDFPSGEQISVELLEEPGVYFVSVRVVNGVFTEKLIVQ